MEVTPPWFEDPAALRPALETLTALYAEAGFVSPHFRQNTLSFFRPALYDAEAGLMLRASMVRFIDLWTYPDPEAAIAAETEFLDSLKPYPTLKREESRGQ